MNDLKIYIGDLSMVERQKELSVLNRVPTIPRNKKYDDVYNYWKYKYNNYLEDLFDIFREDLEKIYPKQQLNTLDFFEIFCNFIFECSTGE